MAGKGRGHLAMEEWEVKDEVHICLVGNCRVGKSSLVQSFTQNHFPEAYTPTVGVEYDSRVMEHEGQYVRVHLYDVCGHRGFLWLAKQSVATADGFVFVYDVNDRATFDATRQWSKLIAGVRGKAAQKLPKALVGNKCDARQNQREVTNTDAKEFAIPENMHQMESSAKTQKNLSVIFYILIGDILRARKLGCISKIANPELSRSQYIERIHEDPEAKFVDNGPDFTHMFKILLVGGKRVGKTAFRLRFSSGHFSPEYYASSGLDFSTRTLLIDDEKVKVQLWDVSGDEIFDATRKGYYKGANAFIIIYDVSSPPSFEHAEKLLKELDMYGQSEAPKVVIGNKSDVSSKKRVDSGTAQEWADGWRLPLIETSCRSGENIEAPVIKLIMALKKQMAPWKRVYDFSK